MTRSAVAHQASAEGTGDAGQPQQPAAPWWRVSWSAPAAMRAARATIVIPGLFAISLKVIGNPQMTIFATFGAFGTLFMTSFGGPKRGKAAPPPRLGVCGPRPP